MPSVAKANAIYLEVRLDEYGKKQLYIKTSHEDVEYNSKLNYEWKDRYPIYEQLPDFFEDLKKDDIQCFQMDSEEVANISLTLQMQNTNNEQQQSNNSNNITCRFSEIVFENSRLTSKEFISSTITLQDFKQQVKRSEQALQTSQETAAQRERSRSPLGGEMRGAVMEQLREDINCFTMVLCGAIIIINNVCLVDFCKLDGYTLKMTKLQVW
jgi:hypothetical protein